MSYNKNPKKTYARRLVFAILLAIIGSSIMLNGNNSSVQAASCSVGTYVDLYKLCLAAQQNGTCPAGTTLNKTIPGPNNCSAPLGADAGASGATNPQIKLGGGGQGKYTCGKPPDDVKISINIGCMEKGTALVDATFAIIRFLSVGVGLVVIGSIVYGGIKYSASRGDPNATAEAVKRIRNSIYALFIYIFSAAILNFLIPAGFFK